MKPLIRCLALLTLQLAAALRAEGLAAPQSNPARSCLRGYFVPVPAGGRSDTGITVTLRGNSHVQQVNASLYGTFEFCGVPAGDYVLEAQANGFEVARIPLRNWDGRNLETGLMIRLLAAPGSTAPPPGAKTVNVKALSVPRPARAELTRFLQYADQQDWEKALSALVKATRIYPEYADAWTNMGIVYTKLNRAGDAETSFRKALGINPEEPVARRKLGLLYISERQFEKAIPELEAAAKLNPLDARTQTYLGHALGKTGHPQEAERHLKSALLLEPDMPQALYELGFAQLKQGRQLDALATFERFLDKGRTSPETEEVRALISQMRGRLSSSPDPF